MSTIKVNKIDKRTGSTLELGGPGTAVTLACGATQTGFGRTGTVDWCTTAKTSPFTAVSGDGFFVNTTSGGITVTAPDVVFTKKPSPLTAVKGEVLAVVHQSTVPVLPNPVCVAPQAKVTVVPDSPNVSVLPVLFVTVFTLIVLII